MPYNKEIEQKICELQGKLRDYVINNKKAPENTLVNGIIAICTRFAREIAESADIYKSIAVTSEETREKEKYEIENKAKLEVLKVKWDADMEINKAHKEKAMILLETKHQLTEAEAQGVKKVKKEISERNSRNARKKSEKGQTLTEREQVFREAKNLMNDKNKEQYYRKDGAVNMAKLVKDIIFQRTREGKESKTDRTYIEWLTNDEYIKKYGNWKE